MQQHGRFEVLLNLTSLDEDINSRSLQLVFPKGTTLLFKKDILDLT